MDFFELLQHIQDLAFVIKRKEQILANMDEEHIVPQEAKHEVEEALLHLDRATYFLRTERDSVKDRN